MKAEGKDAFEERIKQAENSFFFEIRVLSQNYDLKDPEAKTKFHKEIAMKLCEFSVEVERENYIEAIAEKYHIGFENLRKLVNSYAGQTGLAKPVERPKSGIQQKNTPQENVKKSQRLLITWITDEPEVYAKIQKYITAEDFTEELYQKVASRLFEDLSQGTYNPAAIISMFSDEEEQREAAALFNTNLPQLNTKQEKEKVFHDSVSCN
jgi:DNA primase